ncbi:unnamed protein product [Moneuplotes crassus]|uniref:H/ACA ribonucleoprotein complex subunit n=1 Tax=Euplotes crassus TaxID=5936 RepID=A0AAD1XMX7_EUPCR|nr:unnamed protein product [Moneuplotes crassus]
MEDSNMPPQQDDLNSDTSSDEEIEEIIKSSKNPKKDTGSEMDAESVVSMSTYKTKNEISQNDIQQILKFMPKMLDKEIDIINPLGVVKNFIPPHTLFVQKDDQSRDILDLDNFICNEKKELIGYIDEVVGPVNDPFYTVMLYPSFLEQTEKDEINLEALFTGNQVYFVEKTKKLVFWNNLLNQKGCDASNIYDEEIIEPSEQDFSDDEQEKEKRKRRDQKRSTGIMNAPENVYRKRDVKHAGMGQFQQPAPYNYQPQIPQFGQNMPEPYVGGYAPTYSPAPPYPPQGETPMMPGYQPGMGDVNYRQNPPYGYPPYFNKPQ